MRERSALKTEPYYQLYLSNGRLIRGLPFLVVGLLTVHCSLQIWHYQSE
jgi:hypothetical protein